MNNHIGTVLEVLKDIANDNGWNYSHGTITEKGFKNVTVYPLLHAAIQGVTLDKQTADVTINVGLVDVVNTLATENEQDNLVNKYNDIGYTDNENYAHILQDLYVKFGISLRKYNELRFSEIQIQMPVSMDSIIEEDKQVLAGWNISLTVEVQSTWVTDGNC